MQGAHVHIDGIETYVIDVGEGSTIVLLHGGAFGFDAESTWFRTIEGLRDDYRVVAFDQIGFGRTAMPTDGVYKNRLERVDHALAVLDRLGIEDACLVGHSEGAFMAARIAIVEPARARSLVLITTGGTAPYLGGDADNTWIAACEAAYNDPDKLRSEEAYIASLKHLMRSPDDRLDTLLRAGYHRAIAARQDAMFENFPESETDYQLYRNLQETYVLPFLGDLAIPTLLLWSGDDPTVPVSRAELLLEHLADGELVVIDGAGHNVMIEKHEECNDLLRAFAK